jgi:hypothetical protein
MDAHLCGGVDVTVRTVGNGYVREVAPPPLPVVVVNGIAGVAGAQAPGTGYAYERRRGETPRAALGPRYAATRYVTACGSLYCFPSRPVPHWAPTCTTQL